MALHYHTDIGIANVDKPAAWGYRYRYICASILGMKAGKRKKAVSEQATPFFSRIYKRHRVMIKALLKDKKKYSSSADIVRRGIEKLFEEHEAETKIV